MCLVRFLHPKCPPNTSNKNPKYPSKYIQIPPQIPPKNTQKNVLEKIRRALGPERVRQRTLLPFKYCILYIVCYILYIVYCILYFNVLIARMGAWGWSGPPPLGPWGASRVLPGGGSRPKLCGPFRVKPSWFSHHFLYRF